MNEHVEMTRHSCIASHANRGVWVLAATVDGVVFEHLGDARNIASQLGEAVNVLLVNTTPASNAQDLHVYGADDVHQISVDQGGQTAQVSTAAAFFRDLSPRVIFADGSPSGREWASRLAVRMGWDLASPALSAEVRDHHIVVTVLSPNKRLARRVTVPIERTVVATFKAGVAKARTADLDRSGHLFCSAGEPVHEAIISQETIHADPRTVDIRFSRRIVAGGRGLGNAAGFKTLRDFAVHLNASIGASRVAVDLGWIESARQVGQTGKSVEPDLYIACGISGASHHLEGMSRSKHIIAINRDRNAPLLGIAHLSLAADLFEVLELAESMMS
jgi:electron transfer flavoprotein alpha subunit